MAYLVQRPFQTITVVPDGNILGGVSHAVPGEWFRPDIEVTGRVRNLIEDHVMICLAGVETQARWAARQDDVPADLEDQLRVGAAHDLNSAVGLALPVGGSTEETEAYIEWLRQRVLNYVGRGDADGDERFWRLVYGLADAVQVAGTLRWRQARDVLRTADQQSMAAGLAAHSVFGEAT